MSNKGIGGNKSECIWSAAVSCALHTPPCEWIHSCFGKSTQCMTDSFSFSKEDEGEQADWFCKCVFIMGSQYHSPYVGMARFQDGGANQCISIFMAISSPREQMLASKSTSNSL